MSGWRLVVTDEDGSALYDMEHGSAESARTSARGMRARHPEEAVLAVIFNLVGQPYKLCRMKSCGHRLVWEDAERCRLTLGCPRVATSTLRSGSFGWRGRDLPPCEYCLHHEEERFKAAREVSR